MLEENYILQNLIRFLKNNKSLDQARRLLRLRKDTFAIVLKRAVDLGILRKKKRKLILTDKGISFALKKDLNFLRCNCNVGYKVPKELQMKAKEFCNLRVIPNVEIDQCPTKPRDLAKRIAFMYENEDLNNKRILCVGDNDFASLLMFEIAEPKEVVVIDIDERVLSVINIIAKKRNWPIKTKIFDIRKLNETNYPKGIESKFDVFQTDPPYTEVGFKYYLALGMFSLKRRGICYLVAPHMRLEQWSDDLLYEIEKFILDHGFLITDILPSFQTFIDRYGVISSIVRAERKNLIKNPFLAIRPLNIDKFYTIR